MNILVRVLQRDITKWKHTQVYMFRYVHVNAYVKASQVAQMVKNLPANVGDLGSIPGGRNGNPLQYS